MNMRISKDKMDIGLFNLEPKIHNSAMMQVAQYWKERGSNVWEYHPLFDYDKVYAFSLFEECIHIQLHLKLNLH